MFRCSLNIYIQGQVSYGSNIDDEKSRKYILFVYLQNAQNIALCATMKQNVLNVHKASTSMRYKNVKVSIQ